MSFLERVSARLMVKNVSRTIKVASTQKLLSHKRRVVSLLDTVEDIAVTPMLRDLLDELSEELVKRGVETPDDKYFVPMDLTKW